MGLRISAFLGCFFLLVAPALAKKPIPVNDKFFKQFTQSNEIKVLSFNAHNLFDTRHDKGHFDYTYLPLSHPDKMDRCRTMKPGYYKDLCIQLDWTPRRLQRKIVQIRKMMTRHGSLPDILALQEVENDYVVQLLAHELGYDDFIVTRYGNRRGIDVAVLFNYSKVKYIDHTTVSAPGRNPLRVHFLLRNSKKSLFFYVNHWPAQSAPKRMRVACARALRDDIDEISHIYNKPHIIAVGDFNVAHREEREIFDGILLSRYWDNHLVEAHQVSRQRYPQYRNKFPEGSFWLSRSKKWQRYDRIFISNNMLKGSVRAKINSYRILYSRLITGDLKYKVDGSNPKSKEILVRVPLKYNFLEKEGRPLGYSDHLPVGLIITN